MSVTVELGLIETKNKVYIFCKVCKKLAAHEIVWLQNESVLLPTQFGNRYFSFVTIQSKCLICESKGIKYLKIKGKIDRNSADQKSEIASLLMPPLFSKTMVSRGEQGEPHDHGEPCNEVGWCVYEKSTG